MAAQENMQTVVNTGTPTGAAADKPSSEAADGMSEALRQLARKVRLEILEMVRETRPSDRAQECAPGGSLSAVEVLVTLFFDAMRTTPSRAQKESARVESQHLVNGAKCITDCMCRVMTTTGKIAQSIGRVPATLICLSGFGVLALAMHHSFIILKLIILLLISVLASGGLAFQRRAVSAMRATAC